MATYYSSWSTFGDVLARIYLETSYTQDKAKRTSTVSTRLLVQFSGDRGSAYTYPTTVNNSSVTISGTKYSYSTSYSKYASDVFVLGSSSKVIQHDSQGKANYTVSASAKWQEAQDGVSGTLTISERTIPLPDLPSVSTITNNTSKDSPTEFGTAVAFDINRYSDTYTHELTYTVEGTKYTIGTGIATSIEYTFSTDLVSKFASTATPSITVTCTTYGDTTIGSNDTIVYLKVPDTYVPALDLVLSDVGSVPSSWGVYVKNKSKIKGVISAEGSAGSTISLYNTSANEQTFNTSEFTTNELKSSGNATIKSTVTDSRGRTATTTKTINVLDYFSTSMSSFSVKRCTADGTLDEFGTYGKVVCTYSIASVSNKNAKNLKVKFGTVEKTFELSSYAGTVTATSSQLFSGLSIDSAHNFEFYLSDSFETNKFSCVVPIATCLVSKRTGGKGIAFGRVATEDKFVVALPSEFEQTANFTKITQGGKDIALKTDIPTVPSVPTAISMSLTTLVSSYSTSSITVDISNYQALYIRFHPQNGSAYIPAFIPMDDLSSTQQGYQGADETNYISTYLTKTGNSLKIVGRSRSQSTGTYVIYGVKLALS